MVKDFEITDCFTPLMLASISLVAFLSIRNGHLATKTREICKDLSCSKDDELWQWSYTLQLKYFVHRYKLNNLALIVAISSVFLFGLMIAFTVIGSLTFSFNLKESAPSFLLVGGGLFATTGVIISIIETYKGRNSLFAFVATTLIKLHILDSKYPIFNNIISIEKKIRGHLPDNLSDELSKLLLRIK
jgi:hypothetical protein